jgi:hypothetical protein
VAKGHCISLPTGLVGLGFALALQPFGYARTLVVIAASVNAGVR